MTREAKDVATALKPEFTSWKRLCGFCIRCKWPVFWLCVRYLGESSFAFALLFFESTGPGFFFCLLSFSSIRLVVLCNGGCVGKRGLKLWRQLSVQLLSGS